MTFLWGFLVGLGLGFAGGLLLAAMMTVGRNADYHTDLVEREARRHGLVD